MSRTTTFILIEPDLGGLPPSNAVNSKLISSCFSRSTGVCNTISTYLLPSARECCFKTKLSLGLSV
uniref:Uncharacterized protein n=1 Tax=Erpetoichthys calabaricus TaxID=27687 RepID=A0A8C4SGH4_ERPCA